MSSLNAKVPGREESRQNERERERERERETETETLGRRRKQKTCEETRPTTQAWMPSGLARSALSKLSSLNEGQRRVHSHALTLLLSTQGRKSLVNGVAISPAAPTRTEIASDSRAGMKFLALAANSNRVGINSPTLRIASPTRPYKRWFEHPVSRKPTGRNRSIWAGRRLHNRQPLGH